MRVKKYIVDSMSDALQQIRTDLGKDAIILNTKPIKTGGFLGMFCKKKIEVIAAIDPNESKEKETVKNIPQSPASFVAPSTQPAPTFSNVLQTVALQTGSAQRAEEEVQSGSVSKELEEMRGMLWKLMMADDKNTSLPEAFIPLRKRLQSQGMEEDVLASLFERMLKELSPEEMQDDEKVRQKAKEIIVTMLREASGKHGPLQPDTSLVTFIGPTGVGKTTTLAKLAAESTLARQKKVGMITSDTYRIAAVEQLKTYANILNVPLKIVYSAEELVPTLERLTGCDMIFMDTAGRNYRNKEYVEEINRLLRSPLPNETFLVLSLTAKQEDLEAIIESFKGVRIDKVIFTKTDETSTYGSIFNLIIKYKLALSYITTGQNVPDDIEPANPETVAELILGEIRE
ncbi:flagellar biosynthesis protein FlhF [Aneurinibacillus aneurinilyticus]|uniref:flagellar biosynthesis protein FlhF n=1 Tax=Aneurinibacillus aneurinilyticus TaxID=1391 RepID=UPI002E23E7F9|nr:flagellar biosynthesis protein FlhF [Aneurinibacillus aneurinilyticus]MED0669337.1 flagellar biosynthesis protein FlhF [Aneurinibacillus aneurinilyticus]